MNNFFVREVSIPNDPFIGVYRFLQKYAPYILVAVLGVVSAVAYLIYFENGLGLAYNDARSHLDIGRRVVEGLKPGFAQLGSVWLPLPHALMVPTIWNDYMWHTGLSGAIQSMVSFVATGLLVFCFLRNLKAGLLASFFGVAVFVANLNILYLQSTAMTELLLLATMTAGVYELLLWAKNDKMVNLVLASLFVMLSTLIRYDGWFLLFTATILVGIIAFKKRGFRAMEGTLFFFLTLASFGIILWLVWNAVIFKDPLYFAFGPYSAHAQQEQLDQAGVLATKGNILLSLKVYTYALFYNSYALSVILAIIGFFVFMFDKTQSARVKIASLALVAPFIFNIVALFLGHSVLFIQGISGNTWFNVRYGVMMVPSIAIFVGYLIHKTRGVLRFGIIGLLFLTILFAFLNRDAVTIDDARVGSSQKNVSEVSGWLKTHAKNKDGFVLISAASHDAIIFSSSLPMKKFIHEGTGTYWESATTSPDRWARWIVMRTNDNNDQTFKLVNQTGALPKYTLVESFPFADIYELKDEYLGTMNTLQKLEQTKELGGGSEVRIYDNIFSNWLNENAEGENGLILISEKNDPIIFSSGITMSRFITEGTREIWKSSIDEPSRYARWIVIRKDIYDPLFVEFSNSSEIDKYYDLSLDTQEGRIYQLKDNHINNLNTKENIRLLLKN